MNPDEHQPQRRIYPENGPQIECSITPSNNGRLIIHKTIIADIKPASYWEAVLKTARERREANDRHQEHHEVNE